MPILLVNDTNGEDIAWAIEGISSTGSGFRVASGNLTTSGKKEVAVSGYPTYDVTYFPVGFVESGKSYRATVRVTDNTTCILGITVLAGVDAQ